MSDSLKPPPFIAMATSFACGSTVVTLSHADGSIKVFPDDASLDDAAKALWKAVFNAYPEQKDDFIKASKEYKELEFKLKSLESRLAVAESLHDVAVTQRNQAWEEAERWRGLALKTVASPNL